MGNNKVSMGSSRNKKVVTEDSDLKGNSVVLESSDPDDVHRVGHLPDQGARVLLGRGYRTILSRLRT